VMSTLWAIREEGTRDFMNRFCERFLDSDNPRQTLPRIQSAFIQGDR